MRTISTPEILGQWGLHTTEAEVAQQKIPWLPAAGIKHQRSSNSSLLLSETKESRQIFYVVHVHREDLELGVKEAEENFMAKHTSIKNSRKF